MAAECIGDDDVVALIKGALPAATATSWRHHIADCDDCRELVAEMTHVVHDCSTSDRATPAGPQPEVRGVRRAGTVGRYVVLEMLGYGGMGVVYRAYDPELDRHVALKLVRAGDRQVALRGRLVREAKAMARVAHRNVLTVFDAGTAGDDVYIAMALVEGGTLRHWLRVERRPWPAILEAFVAAGHGLVAAHAVGLVHRDFKPDNVLRDASGHCYVTDFGLARPSRLYDDDDDGDDRLPSTNPRLVETVTETGAMVGTPAFMAPEQLRGDRVDARADQFSFCVALFEALDGAPPFVGDDVATRMAAVAAGARPGGRAPSWVYRALVRGLRLDRADRWPSMHALLAALAADPMRRRRRIVVGAGVGFTAASLAIGWKLAAPEVAHPCAALAGDARDVYVDAGAVAGGTGVAAGCALRTIAAALAMPTSAPRTIHVAAGRYDRDHGERFPLVVRGDLAIVGTADATTRIVGSGRIDHRAAGGSPASVFDATFVIGDARGTVALTNLVVEGDTPTAEMGRFGIVCDQGNLTAFDGPVPRANTRFAGLTVGPGYDTAIVVGASSVPTQLGCNLAMTETTVRGSYVGLWTTGCGREQTPVRAEIGDGTAAGANMFKSIRSPSRGGIGIRAWDCTRELLLRRNTFEDSDSGVTIVVHGGLSSHVVVERNRFEHMSRVGLALARTTVVERLDDNVFAWSSGRASAPSERAVGLVLDGESEPAPGFPRVLHARGNAFVENDVGIELRGTRVAVAGREPILDFGRHDDPGRNTFHCNATEHGAGAPGFDVVMSVPGDGTGALWFAGNEWDHAPPTVARASVANGTDIALTVGAVPSLDVRDARAHAQPCIRDAGP